MPKTPLKKTAKKSIDSIQKPRKKAVLKKPKKQAPKAAKIENEILKRHIKNPIISPHPVNFWESKATFNPAALYERGKVHILYRAIGEGDVSVLGYAQLDEKQKIKERLSFPAYSHKIRASDKTGVAFAFYGSGGGWSGGAEDPRLVLIDDTIYLLYTAFDGWGSIRIALSSISLKDFKKRIWNWKKPILISPPGQIHKNWVLFPERIGGKYAILTSISPEMNIAYFESLDELQAGKPISSYYERAFSGDSSDVWDSWVRGAGPPPLKTKDGWLLLYHAMDDRDPNRYKLGAMLLDLKDPSKVLYRSQKPVLEPEYIYENVGFKPGVVYACGAVIIGEDLYVYYGGADKFTCVARANLKEFIKEIKKGYAPKLEEIKE